MNILQRLAAWRLWEDRHVRRLLLLKLVVAGGLVTTHYFPNQPAALIVNLIWLIAF